MIYLSSRFIIFEYDYDHHHAEDSNAYDVGEEKCWGLWTPVQRFRGERGMDADKDERERV